ncbi:Nuclear receptor 2C2-associated protein [Heterocephalus glaber]|uniref:Nuclear receptor 2C2-associated protein n=1 Tax=Heterocephalus glaber TaxID=10181 RepID=G5C5C4_HETGA|nr:Nuclear receptor 2C2-associated protein [Heterocephalus glaber]
MTHSLVCPETESRVSSVLNRNTRQFGKKHLFDQDEETCWTSDQGPSQWVTLKFPQRVRVSQLQIQFQGGFSSHRGCLEGSKQGEALSKIIVFYPKDNNSLQISCPGCGTSALVVSSWDWSPGLGQVGAFRWDTKPLFALTAHAHTFPVPLAEVDQLKMTFEDTTDFFGRVVIYHLRVLGEKAA